MSNKKILMIFLVVCTPIISISTLFFGRYDIDYGSVLKELYNLILFNDIDKSTEFIIIEIVRIPRIILAMIVGAGLSMSGAVLQTIFKNPLVSPQFLGFSGGAAFGGALAIFFGLGTVYLISSAFIFALIAIGLVFILSGAYKKASILTVILSGIVITAFFSAATSLLTFFADPYSNMPAIVFWLMGSLASATYEKILIALIPFLIGGYAIFAIRWKINLLSLSDEEAKSFGINPDFLRFYILVFVALIVSSGVAVVGEVGWVGLVIPHIAKIIFGSDCRYLIPSSAFLGAIFLVIVDTFARSLTSVEIPIGILTAFIGSPIFFILLRKYNKKGLNDKG
ncbi:FecCD family ABC transporter permease [Aliarcobacter butzleri]|uniref:FecCD family ABC transporter permease n=1 Tax=Aliarcobacter butzleri TaxID=28197 RepID=UPI0021B5753E|nr:iron ABC transporter permease [Aliarcobacter butzleri]MCT7587327.1 iron ABC transporter permease [Aliarcobacter butzleri]